ncbi:MAG: TolC family protein [Acidobacteriota bacterium]|jgi:outer membrane protein TolC|nr:TolC family protein [Acidobacteriota bacterium]
MRRWCVTVAFAIQLGCAGAAAQTVDGAADMPVRASSLGLEEAVRLALENNLRTVAAAEGVAQAKGAKGASLSALLPHLSAVASQTNLTANLAALGMPMDAMPMPAFVGPYNRFDARVQLAQSVFDLAAVRRWQASGEAVEAARAGERLAEQTVAAATAVAYLAALEAAQGVESAQANLRLAETLRDLAEHQKGAGLAAGIDVARAETRLANQKVGLARAQTALDNARLDLFRLVAGSSGEPLAAAELGDTMRIAEEPAIDAAEAVRQALAERPEVALAERELKVAELGRKAASAGHLPTIGVFGDYGSSGLLPNDTSLPTRSVGVQMNLPVFDGGRTRAETRSAASRQREAEARLKDVRAEVEKDVRQALLNVGTFKEQAEAAKVAVALAERELELSRDRFANGVADNTEMVAAQAALENARQVYVSAVAGYNLARLNLAAALGHAERFRL